MCCRFAVNTLTFSKASENKKHELEVLCSFAWWIVFKCYDWALIELSCCRRVSERIGTEDCLLSDPQTGNAQALLRDLRQADVQRLPAAGAQRTQVRHLYTSSVLVSPNPRHELVYFPTVLYFKHITTSLRLFTRLSWVLGVLNQGVRFCIHLRLRIACTDVTLALFELGQLPPNTQLFQSCFTHTVMW